MSEYPLFSVIIPVYKVEKYIGDCIRSVQNQECDKIEIILVDDGSPDLCPEICDNFAREDPRIRVIHTSNGGVSSARKKGCNIAKGKYLIFLDSDDWISSDCLSVLEKQCNTTNADIICFGMHYETQEKYEARPLNYRYGYYSRQDIEKEIFPMLIQKSDASYFAPSLCGKAIKKELFSNNALINRECTIGEDGACIIPAVFYAQSMVVLENCLYYYRYNFESATKGKKVIPWSCPEIIYNHIKEKIDLDTADFKEQADRKLVHDIFNTAVSQFHRNESYKVIVRDITNKLNGNLYRSAIENSHFSDSLAATLMQFALKHRIYLLLYVFSKHRR